jgi:hypothetical protein
MDFKGINKRIDIIGCCFDILIIFAPFSLLMDNGLNIFMLVFYIIYLPNLIFNIYKYIYNKKNKLSIYHEFEKIVNEDFFIHH